MKVLVLYNEPAEDASVDEQDVLTQRDTVAAALQALGHEVICFGCTLDFITLREQLLGIQPDVVFNLVESLAGTDRLMPVATLLLESLSIPYTGARTGAILTSLNKLSGKQHLQQHGLPTALWRQHPTPGSELTPPFPTGKGPTCWILKPVWEHASFGMDDAAVVTVSDEAELNRLWSERERRINRPHFAEQFIDGREFNLSLLCGEVLPPAEIDFSAFPPDKPRIVGQAAKWEEDSFEYNQTPRRFDYPAEDAPLVERLTGLARDCWQAFGLTGYARVDFRVDSDGQPWILEINPNPCLSPEAGFAAAVERAGLTFPQAMQRILDEAFLPNY